VLLTLVTTAAAVLSPVLAEAAGSQEAAGDPEGERYFEAVFDQMTSTTDIVYGSGEFSSGETRDLHLDLYEPTGDTAEKRPVIVLLHGGFFSIGNHKDDNYGAGPDTAKTFTDLGYVVAAVEYRQRVMDLVPPSIAPPELLAEYEEAGFDAGEDLNAAIGWMRDNAADYRIDPDATVPYGFSAGGIMAWSLAWMPGSGRDAPRVPAAVSVAGYPYVETIAGETVAAPSAGDAPVLDYHGTDDGIVSYADAAEPCARAVSVGVRCELVTYEGVGHPLNASDTDFVPRYLADAHLALEFIGEEVLVPLGYIDEVPSFDPPPPPPIPAPSPNPDPSPPIDPAGGGTSGPPAARPASPIPGDPDYTG
jgi:acetyl esterase/lipase